MRRLGSAGRTADDVAGADFSSLGTVTQHALAFDDEEHLLFSAMTVERTGAFPRRGKVIGKAEILGAEQRADAHGVALEHVAFGEMLELQLIDVDHLRIDYAH